MMLAPGSDTPEARPAHPLAKNAVTGSLPQEDEGLLLPAVMRADSIRSTWLSNVR